MAPDSPPPWLQIGALAVLTGAAAATLVQIPLARTPAPPPLPPVPTGIAGYRLRALPGQAAGADRHLARSGLRRWAVQAVEPGGLPLELTLVNLHSRSHKNLQLAALTSDADAPPSLVLRQRWLLPRGEAAAIGRLEGISGRGGRTALQSCLIGADHRAPTGSGRRLGGVTQNQLTGQLEWKRRGGPGLQGLGRDLAQLLGLVPNVL